jgi:hypothetical protein
MKKMMWMWILLVVGGLGFVVFMSGGADSALSTIGLGCGGTWVPLEDFETIEELEARSPVPLPEEALFRERNGHVEYCTQVAIAEVSE